MAAKVPAAGVDLDGAVTVNESSADVDLRVESNGNANMLFVNGGTDRIGVGINDPVQALEVRGQIGISASGTGSKFLGFYSSDTLSAFLEKSGDNLTLYNVDAGNLILATGDAERMRITSTGQLSIGASGPVGSSRLFFYASASTPYGLITQNNATTGSMYAAQFLQNDGSTELGSIKISNTGTAFNTSSDYRLKENVVTDWDATTRLKQLKPSRFNFISDADTTVDGFLAHEVSSIVPEAISGDKDATETKTKVVVNSSGFVIRQDVEEADWIAGKVADEDGNTEYPTDSTWEASKVMPAYQGIDQSKLVPLLVKTVQELEARIKTLEDA